MQTDSSNQPTPWIIIPFINNLDMTKGAIQDALAQSVVPNVLAIDNGSSEDMAKAIDEWSFDKPRLFIWHHNPSLRSLAATWNLALDFVWGLGNTEAMVCNNDIKLLNWTYHQLAFTRLVEDALLVSGVGVTYDLFILSRNYPTVYGDFQGPMIPKMSKGGPDFSCYLITKACHDKYRFDENFVPAYCEDLDYHRRLLLSGNGARIFSINVPYLHIDSGSGTLKSMHPEARAKLEAAITNGSRAYYKKKWGGGVNEEQFTVPFDPINSVYTGPLKTHELFDQVRDRWNQ